MGLQRAVCLTLQRTLEALHRSFGQAVRSRVIGRSPDVTDAIPAAEVGELATAKAGTIVRDKCIRQTMGGERLPQLFDGGSGGR